MLPFDRKPWAKHVAGTVIVVTLIAAVVVPVMLHARKALDLPILVGIALLLLAIIPPNLVVFRRRSHEEHEAQAQPRGMYGSRRPAIR